jgi:hypothetical protein
MPTGRTQTPLFALDAPPPRGVESIEWYSPEPEIALVHDVLGGPPELDPLSCIAANRIVRAERFYGVADDGMAQSWCARTAYVNPPTGLTQPAWAKLVYHVLAGDIGAGIWAGFSVEQLQTLQNAGAARTPVDFPLCVPSQRTRWMRGDGRQQDLFGEPHVGTSPRHGTFFALLGGSVAMVRRFVAVFRQLGAVSLPMEMFR